MLFRSGRALGAGDLDAVGALTRRLLAWAVGAGVVTGITLAAASPVLGALFTDDAAVRERLVPVLLVAAVAQPLAGVVFLLDGVLIGAGDGRYLALAGLVVTLLYAPIVLAAGPHGVVAVWTAFAAAFMGGRGVVLVARARGGSWRVPGA